MRQLRLVGLAEDGDSLVLESPTGESYRLPLDERVRAACRGDLTRLGQIEIEMDNPLRPREIQMRVRAGESAEQVAASSGMPLDRVLRFASAVLQERSRVVAQARTTAIRPKSADQLGPLVEERLVGRGTDPASLRWDAWRGEDGGWSVRLAWRHGGDRGLGGDREHTATWAFDLARRLVRPADPAAEQLSAQEYHARTITAVTPLAVAARAADEAVRPGADTRARRPADDRPSGRPAAAPDDPAPSGRSHRRPGPAGGRPDQDRAPRQAEPDRGRDGGPAGPPRGRREATGARDGGPGEVEAAEAARSRFDEIRAGGPRSGAGRASGPGPDRNDPPARPDGTAGPAAGTGMAGTRPTRDGTAGPGTGGTRPTRDGTAGAGGTRPTRDGTTGAGMGGTRSGEARAGGPDAAEPAGRSTGELRAEARRPADRSARSRPDDPRGQVRRVGPRPGEAADGGDADPVEEPRRMAAAGGGSTIPGMVVDGAPADDDRARRATVPSWDDILLGVRRRH